MRSTFELVDSTEDPVTDLISLELLKLELGITDDSQDDLLESRITRQSLLIAEYCNRVFGLSEAIETFYFDANEHWHQCPWPVLVLRLYPVVEVTSILIDGVEVDEDNIRLDKETGRLWLDSVGWGSVVQVTYSGGYDLPDSAPAGLIAAIIEAMRQTQAFAARDPSIRETSHGDTSVGFYSQPLSSSGLPSTVAELLKPFRRLTAV